MKFIDSYTDAVYKSISKHYHLSSGIQNFNEYFNRILLAANKDSKEAQFNLITLYFDNQYIDINLSEAFKWLKAAVE